jgi:hypothetical protein
VVITAIIFEASFVVGGKTIGFGGFISRNNLIIFCN